MPEREVERERARGDRVEAHLRALVAHAHDRALAELALDLRERALKGGVARLGGLLLVGHGHGLTPPGSRWNEQAKDAPRTERLFVSPDPFPEVLTRFRR